ncbi:unnamed protein product [Microthlaspi erraticum]|uniref:F-box domain-containing protein n=1 Tax=Microthlaspi erraticum TaxID=1685480 RepID=A0A6D2HG15_9BRAS|nr:unnamed protein product [Microthlaspi erraticum]
MDRISDLPDSLVTKILSYLSTKDSVKTSVLSKGWESVWLRVPALDLRYYDFPNGQAMESFMDKFLEVNKYSQLQTFMIQSNRVTVGLETPKCSVYLPCLKTMSIDDVWFDYDDPLTMERIIADCPALEDLTVIISRNDESCKGYFLKHLRVRSQILKRFCLMFWNRSGGKNRSVEIDAPSLEYMSFRELEGHQSAKIVVKNLSSLVMVDIDSKFEVYPPSLVGPEDTSQLMSIHDFFAEISGVRHMIISTSTVKARFSCNKLQLLPKLLHSCINLKDLIVDFDAVDKVPMGIKLIYVPQCLIKTLECVEINELEWNEEYGMKLVNYFVENSVILKKLTVRFIDSPVSNQEREVYRELLNTIKRSIRCQVSIY